MNTKAQQKAFLVLRIAMGVNLLGHGLARFSKLQEFRSWMVKIFQDTFLPNWAIAAWGSVLPFLEFGIGLLLIIGLSTYKSSIAGAIIIILLLFGSCLIENWEWVTFQMIYILFYYVLISKTSHNTWALDNVFNK